MSTIYSSEGVEVLGFCGVELSDGGVEDVFGVLVESGFIGRIEHI